MATIKILLKKNKQNEDGSYPLYLRAIKDRNIKFMSLGIKLYENQWDEKEQRVKKNHPNSVRMNGLISKKKAEAEAETLDLALEERTFNEHSFEQVKGRSKHDFFQFAQKYIDNLLANDKIGTYRRAKYTVEKLKSYKNQEPLYFHELTVQFLKDYQEHLVGLGNKVNTIHSNLKLSGLRSSHHSFRKHKNKGITSGSSRVCINAVLSLMPLFLAFLSQSFRIHFVAVHLFSLPVLHASSVAAIPSPLNPIRLLRSK